MESKNRNKNPTLYSEGVTLARTRVDSFAAPLERRKSSTSKLVSAPALASFLQKTQPSYTFKSKHLKAKEKGKKMKSGQQID